MPVVIVKTSIGCGCLSSAKGWIDRLYSHNSIDSINYAHILVDQGSLKYKLKRQKKKNEMYNEIVIFFLVSRFFIIIIKNRKREKKNAL